jgi:hypothetical protein
LVLPSDLRDWVERLPAIGGKSRVEHPNIAQAGGSAMTLDPRAGAPARAVARLGSTACE